MERAVVTGGMGFIGTHLCNKLSFENYRSVALDNLSHPARVPLHTNAIYRYGDVRYKDDLAPYIKEANIVFHLAAQINVDRSIERPQETIDINVGGTSNVLELCKKYHKKLVIASTSEIYGSSDEPIDEFHALNPQSPYGASKAAADRLAYSYYKAYGLDVRILRNFNTFGPGQNDGKAGKSYGSLISIFTRHALNGTLMEIFGDGEQERDYMFVYDAVRAYIAVMHEGKPGEAYNAGSGETIKVKDLPTMIAELLQKPVKSMHIHSRPGEVQRLCANADKIKALGWKPKWTFKKALNHFIKDYERRYFNTKPNKYALSPFLPEQVPLIDEDQGDSK